MSRHCRRLRARAFTITEILVVLAIIVLLIAILLPTLSAVRKQGVVTTSMNNLRQIATWMRLYSDDNRDTIVPSQFDYTMNSYPGKVRSVITPGVGAMHEGTWTDILWSENNVAIFTSMVAAPPDGSGHDYRFDSPDDVFYRNDQALEPDNPFRSQAPNTQDQTGANPGPPGNEPIPMGQGGFGRGLPGYFAANQFFDARTGVYRSNSQIRHPDRSMYAVDSYYGEVIGVIDSDPASDLIICEAFKFDNGDPAAGLLPTGQVDFRYVGDAALLLMLDGRVEVETRWDNLTDLEARGVRIRRLDSLGAPPDLVALGCNPP